MRLSSVPNTTKTSTETKSRNAKRQSLWPYVCALYRCGMISQKAISHEQLLSDHVLDTTMQIAEEIYLVGKLVCLTTIAFFSLQFLNFLTTNFLTTKIYVFFFFFFLTTIFSLPKTHYKISLQKSHYKLLKSHYISEKLTTYARNLTTHSRLWWQKTYDDHHHLTYPSTRERLLDVRRWVG